MLHSQEIWQEDQYEPYRAPKPSAVRLSFSQKGILAGIMLTTMMLMGMGETTDPAAMMGGLAAEPEATSETNGGISRIFSPGVQAWETEILEWSAEWGLDPNLVATVMQIESCGSPKALSGSGAQGLFQVMPYHFEEGDNGYHPETNARRGLGYLRKALEAFHGDVRLALAGYNGGINGAGRPESEWTNEMLHYVHWGENIYAEAKNGAATSATIQAWLEAGGDHLCTQAKGETAFKR